MATATAISNKELRKVAKQAARRGWIVERKSRSGHMTIRHEKFPGHWHTLASSPSDRNAAQHVTRRLLRCEQGRCEHGAPYPMLVAAAPTPAPTTERDHMAKVQQQTVEKLDEIAASTPMSDAVKWEDSHVDLLVECVNTFEHAKDAFRFVEAETGIAFSRVQAQYYRWMRSDPKFAARINRTVDSKYDAKAAPKTAAKTIEAPKTTVKAPEKTTSKSKGKYHILNATETGELFLAFATEEYNRQALAERFNISTSTVSNHHRRFQEIAGHVMAPLLESEQRNAVARGDSNTDALRKVVGEFLDYRDSAAEYEAAMKSDIPASMKAILKADRDAKQRDWIAEIRSAYEGS